MWRFRKNNLLINDKDNLFVHRVHLERLLHTKAHIKNKGPEIPYFMKNKLSQKELLRVKERKRCYENGIIFSRLLEINKSISPYSKTNQPIYCPAFDKKRHHFDKMEKIKDLCKENKFLFSRLVSERSYYPAERHFNINDFEIYLKGNIKRQRIDNPNINFVTFTQFRKNLCKKYKLKKSHSCGMMLEPACLSNKNQKKCKNDIKSRNNNNNLIYGYTSFKTNKHINSKKINNGNYNTLIYTKKGKNLNRCQSAIIRREKDNNF